MEREEDLRTSKLAVILGVGETILGELTDGGVLKPIIAANGGRFWEDRDIFRAFAALVLMREYETKYGLRRQDKYKYAQVRSNLMIALRNPDRFLATSEWRAVAERAVGMGFDFAGTDLAPKS